MKKTFFAAVILLALSVAVFLVFTRKVELHTQLPQQDISGTHSFVKMISPLASNAPEPQIQADPVPRVPGARSVQLAGPIADLCAAKTAMPLATVVKALKYSDESQLLDLYNQENELTNRTSITWALAAIGGDESANVLKKTLIADYQRRALAQAEWEVLRDTIVALGFISSRSQNAYQFLLKASAGSYWQAERKWTSTSKAEEEYSDRRFAGLAIQSLGASKHDGMVEFLAELQKQNSDFVRSISGAVTTSAFNVDFVKENGAEALLEQTLSGSSMYNFMKWQTTANGKAWNEWYIATVKKSPAPSKP